MNKEQFGSFIASNRKAAGLTQKALAERLHVTDKAVSKWERALSYPDVTLLEPLAEVFGLGVEELVACEKKKKEEAQPMKEEQSVKAVLEISRENQQRARKKVIQRVTVSALVMLGVVLAVVWYLDTYVSERQKTSIFLKETVGKNNYLYVEQEGHLLQLKCGSGVDFDSIELTDEYGEKRVYLLDCRWNRKTYQGTVSACEATNMTILGGLMDTQFETVSVLSLFGETDVYYTSENYFPNPYGEPRGKVYLCDYRFWAEKKWDSQVGEWKNGPENPLLQIKRCLTATVADIDGDGEQEVIARTRWPEKPYTVYDWDGTEIVELWPEKVPEEIREDLLCMWEE